MFYICSHYTVGLDYNAINQILFFPPGATPGMEECFTFLPVDDLFIEMVENIVIQAMSDNPDVVFSQPRNEASINILDNDCEYCGSVDNMYALYWKERKY